MKITFLGQGLNPTTNRQAGQVIQNALNGNEYQSLKVFVAFLSRNGLNTILPELTHFQNTGRIIQFFVGVDLHGTSKEALELLMEHRIETYIVYSPNSLIFHPKVYVFEGPVNRMVLVGSSNLTTTGLFQNVEASVCVKFANNEPDGASFLDELHDHYGEVINGRHSSCNLLTNDILTLLTSNNIVLSETQISTKRNRTESEFAKRDAVQNSKLLSTFGKIKEIRPLRGHNRKIVHEVRQSTSPTSSSVVFEETLLDAGTMWVETRRMTGAARNILDLSMSGVSDTGTEIIGSLSYFDIDVRDRTAQTDITIIHGGKTYVGNTIKFPQGANANNTWRLQLKGRSDDRDTLKTISRPSADYPGGFVNKVLLFKKLDAGIFEMQILPEDYIEKLKEMSAVWGTNGAIHTSKAYGFIAP